MSFKKCCLSNCNKNHKNSNEKTKRICNDESTELSGSEIFAKYKDAIVEIEGTYVSLDTIFIDCGCDPGFFIQIVSRQFFAGSGFFIQGGYIATVGHAAVISDLPNLPAFLPPERIPPAQSLIQRVERLWVEVYNVNGTNKSIIYEADLVGIDGAGDSAVLKINPNKIWNVNLPRIINQPFLEWGDSRSYKRGDPVYAIGYTFAHSYQNISDSIVGNNKGMDHLGFIIYEWIITLGLALAGNSGSALIGKDGRVIGIFSARTFETDLLNFSVSQFFAQPVIETLMSHFLEKKNGTLINLIL